MNQLVRLTVFYFVHTKQDLMEEVKAKLDEEMQDTLDSLGCGAEEDAIKLYEAMKVRLFLLTWWNFGCIKLLKDKGKESLFYVSSKKINSYLTVNKPEADGALRGGGGGGQNPPPPPPTPSLSPSVFRFTRLRVVPIFPRG